MLLKNRDIASKFILIASLVTMAMMAGLAAVIVIKAEQTQSKLAHGFIQTLKKERGHGERLLRQGVLQKGKSTDSAVSAIITKVEPWWPGLPALRRSRSRGSTRSTGRLWRSTR